MKTDTIKDIKNDARDLAGTCKNPLTRFALEGIANRLQILIDADARQPKDPPAGNEEPAEPEHISRAEAVRILMQLQEIEALCGHVNNNAALEIAISNLVKRHRNSCRNRAKRRAARMAAGAAKEGK